MSTKTLFGTDGVRGVANVDLTPELAMGLSRAAGETELNLYFVLTTTGTLHVTAQDRASGQRARASFSLLEK